MSLRETQGIFYNAISQPAGLEGEDLAVDIIKTTGNLSPSQRLDIYRNNSLASRIKAIQQIYPVCRLILGKRVFNNLARDYAINIASLSSDLNSYGESFSDFIENAVHTHKELGEFTYLHDLCELEWLCHKVYYQKNDSSFDFDAFALISDKPSEVNLNLSHSLEILASDYPVYSIWQQHREQQLPPSVKGLDEMEYLCVYRQDFVPIIEIISESHFAFLNACRQRRTLEDMALDSRLSVALQALPKMIEQGWICGFTHQA